MKIKDLPIVSVTGPTCSGKTTFVHKLISTKFESGIRFGEIVSHTTRQQRPGEINGRDYHFISTAQFIDMSLNDAFVEQIEFNCSQYAISKTEIDNSFEGYQIPIVIVEPNGAEQIANYCARHDLNHMCVFIDVDSKVAVKRFLNRDFGSLITDTSLGRLETMHTTERTWRNARKWDFYVYAYDESNLETMPGIFGNLLWNILLAKEHGIDTLG